MSVGAPYVPGSATSKAAAVSIVPDLGRLEGLVFERIARAGDTGLTDDEIEVALELTHQSASARRRGLVQQRLVADSGRTRETRSGRQATVWVATPDNYRKPEKNLAMPGRPTKAQARAAVDEIRMLYATSERDPGADVIRLMQWVNLKVAKRAPNGG